MFTHGIKSMPIWLCLPAWRLHSWVAPIWLLTDIPINRYEQNFKHNWSDIIIYHKSYPKIMLEISHKLKSFWLEVHFKTSIEISCYNLSVNLKVWPKNLISNTLWLPCDYIISASNLVLILIQYQYAKI